MKLCRRNGKDNVSLKLLVKRNAKITCTNQRVQKASEFLPLKFMKKYAEVLVTLSNGSLFVDEPHMSKICFGYLV